jgi:hypothetical protein
VKKPIRVTVDIDGGIVQSVRSDTPDIEVLVLDHDVDYGDEDTKIAKDSALEDTVFTLWDNIQHVTIVDGDFAAYEESLKPTEADLLRYLGELEDPKARILEKLVKDHYTE